MDQAEAARPEPKTAQSGNFKLRRLGKAAGMMGTTRKISILREADKLTAGFVEATAARSDQPM